MAWLILRLWSRMQVSSGWVPGLMRVTYGAGDFPIPTDGAPQRLLVDLGLRLSVGV